MITGPILLPPIVGLKTDKPRMLDWGGALTPPNGGAVQTLGRLGTRHAYDITPPIMPSEPTGRIWSAYLRMAKLYGVVFPFAQDGFRVGPCGSPVVNGSGQSGSTLLMRAFTPGYPISFGQAFSLVHNGRRYLHFAAGQPVAVGGMVALDIFPMLRVIPADGAVCEFAQPMIQGSLSGNEVSWERQTAPWSDFGTITITEDE